MYILLTSAVSNPGYTFYIYDLILCTIFTGGPYHICTAELFDSEGSAPSSAEQKTRIYWKIEWKPSTSNNQQDRIVSTKDCKSASNATIKCNNQQYRIVSTKDCKSASNFYLKPIIQCGKEDYFCIVTDPEDHACRATPSSQEDKGQDTRQQNPHSDKCKPQSSRNMEPQRYVRVCEGNLVVELNINPRSAKKSAFKLKNPRDDQTYPLHKSQWLPEALCGSQPYIIGLEGKPFRTVLNKDQVSSVYMLAKEGEEIKYGKHEYGKHKEDDIPYGFLILESGHKT